MTESGEKEVQDKSVQVSLAELEELRRLKMMQEAKTELLAWGKRWATIFTIFASVVGLIGLNVVVATVVRGFVAEDIKEAQKTAIVATEYLSKARTEMEKATKAATEYTEQIQEMKGKAEAVDKSFKTLESSLEGKGRSVREEAKLLTGDLQNRLEALEKNLADVIVQSSSPSKVAQFRAETERLDREAVERQASFKTNREYTVQISFYEKMNSNAGNIAAALEKLGFQTTITSEARTPEEDVGVPKGTFAAATGVVVVHDKGEEQKGALVAKTTQSVLDKISVSIVTTPQSATRKWMIVFLPRRG